MQTKRALSSWEIALLISAVDAWMKQDGVTDYAKESAKKVQDNLIMADAIEIFVPAYS